MSNMATYDGRTCKLGEGPLWHPSRKQLFWFDILGQQLLTLDAAGPQEWQFDEHVSAAGWIDDDTLLIASETGLSRFDLTTGESEWIAGLEVDKATTRSNDGRADPWGGFWIGTMGKNAEAGAGAIYRYFEGAVQRLNRGLTIPNAICFSPDRSYAYFTDTPTRQIMRQRLDVQGWPDGPAEIFIDLRDSGLNPDGAVVDDGGCLWNAQWGASRVVRYDSDGREMSEIRFAASQISCPAFGGDAMQTLFATSAAIGVHEDLGGATFAIDTGIRGQKEHRVIL